MQLTSDSLCKFERSDVVCLGSRLSPHPDKAPGSCFEQELAEVGQSPDGLHSACEDGARLCSCDDALVWPKPWPGRKRAPLYFSTGAVATYSELQGSWEVA